jgi:hypothetical protein
MNKEADAMTTPEQYFTFDLALQFRRENKKV